MNLSVCFSYMSKNTDGGAMPKNDYLTPKVARSRF